MPMWSTADECMWRKNRKSTSGAISNAVGLASALGAGNIAEITASRPASSPQHSIDGSCLASSIMRVTTSPRMRTTSSMRKSLYLSARGAQHPSASLGHEQRPRHPPRSHGKCSGGLSRHLGVVFVLRSSLLVPSQPTGASWSCFPRLIYRAFGHLTHKRSKVGTALARPPPPPYFCKCSFQRVLSPMIS